MKSCKAERLRELKGSKGTLVRTTRFIAVINVGKEEFYEIVVELKD